jgi:hypothetical protein
MVCKNPHLLVNHISTSLVVFFSILDCVLDCACGDKPSWRGQLMCAQIDNQQSCGVVIARVHLFCSDPSSSTSISPPIDLHLSEDRDSTSHHV